MTRLNSKLWKRIIDSINSEREEENKLQPIIGNNAPKEIKFFVNDTEVTETGVVYQSQDVAGAKKTGDLQIKSFFKTQRGIDTHFIIECKNWENIPGMCDDSVKFFEKCEKRGKKHKAEEFYVLLSKKEMEEV